MAGLAGYVGLTGLAGYVGLVGLAGFFGLTGDVDGFLAGDLGNLGTADPAWFIW